MCKTPLFKYVMTGELAPCKTASIATPEVISSTLPRNTNVMSRRDRLGGILPVKYSPSVGERSKKDRRKFIATPNNIARAMMEATLGLPLVQPFSPRSWIRLAGPTIRASTAPTRSGSLSL